MFYDNSRLKYENSPPPTDFEYDDTPIFFSFPRPQSVKVPESLKIDCNLIHPSLFDIKNEEDSENIIENKINEIIQEDAVKDANKIIDKNFEELEQLTNNKKIYKKKVSTETGSSCRGNDKSADILQKEEHASTGKKNKKHHKRKETKRVFDPNDENNIHNTSDEVISKSCPKKSKTSVKHSSKHSKSKYSRPAIVSDNDKSSYSNKSITSDNYFRKSKKYKSISSDEERPLLYKSETSHKKLLRSPEAKVKEEVFFDDEKSYLRNPRSLSNKRFSNSDDSSDNESYITRNHEKRYYDDRISECYSPKKEEKPDVKLEPNSENSKEIHGSYYCPTCKLSLNSELTWQSHIRGKRHAKAQRAQSIHEVFKSSLLSSTNVSFPEEGNRHDKPPPGMKRIELTDAVSKIQSVCDDFPSNRLIGLGHVWEIQVENGTLHYYCNLCDADCAASSIARHLVGYKHRLQYLKANFPALHEKYKNAHKKEVEIIMEDMFDYVNFSRKEKVRVFRDIPFPFKKSRSYSCDQPGSSWEVDSFPGTKQEKVVITDENGKSVIPSNQEFLDTKYADFHCTVCDCHMNNIGMWETHIRGKRHLKNMKKTQQGAVTTNKYKKVSDTFSNLQKQIKKRCEADKVIVGLDFIRENQGEYGNQYNCFLCGGCFSDVDIIDHILNLKHKTKYLEKMHADGFENGIMEINTIEVSNYYREEMVTDECRNMVLKYGSGNPQVYNLKKVPDL